MKHLIASILVTFVLIILVLLFLRIYTRHNREFVVPDLTGMTEEKYSEALDVARRSYAATREKLASDRPEKLRGAIVYQP